MTDKTSLINIMIVEDESIIAKDIQNMLRRFGYAATLVSSGEEAIKKSARLGACRGSRYIGRLTEPDRDAPGFNPDGYKVNRFERQPERKYR